MIIPTPKRIEEVSPVRTRKSIFQLQAFTIILIAGFRSFMHDVSRKLKNVATEVI